MLFLTFSFLIWLAICHLLCPTFSPLLLARYLQPAICHLLFLTFSPPLPQLFKHQYFGCQLRLLPRHLSPLRPFPPLLARYLPHAIPNISSPVLACYLPFAIPNFLFPAICHLLFLTFSQPNTQSWDFSRNPLISPCFPRTNVLLFKLLNQYLFQ